jgi:small subunit ribosomal protein S1
MEKEEDFAALFAEYEQANKGKPRVPTPKAGDRIRGKVTSIGSGTVFVALDGGQGEGMLDVVEVRDHDGKLTVAVGDSIEATVIEGGGRGQQLVLRRGLARGPDARADLARAFELGLPVEGTITAVNKGGVDVMVAGVRAFCPISQLDTRRTEDASSMVGMTMSFRITKYEEDRRGPNLIVSRRAVLEEEGRARAVETRAKLVVGAVLPGIVTSLKDYGAFIDLGGIEGMLHVSEIGFSRVTRPADVLTVGQAVSVQVIRIEKKSDPNRPEQVALSLKALATDPWEEASARFTEGTRVQGTIMRLEPFGAFVELAPGVEGLLHISALGGGKPIRHPRDVLKAGDHLEVTVTAVDRERRRLSLVPAGESEAIDAEARAVADRAGGTSKLGTFGDLLKGKLPTPKG